jgi:hypothetical protein
MRSMQQTRRASWLNLKLSREDAAGHLFELFCGKMSMVLGGCRRPKMIGLEEHVCRWTRHKAASFGSNQNL